MLLSEWGKVTQYGSVVSLVHYETIQLTWYYNTSSLCKLYIFFLNFCKDIIKQYAIAMGCAILRV